MALKLPIYMDNHATTPCDPRVVEAMLPFFTEYYGNAASRSHSFGWTAEAAVDHAREQIASLIGGSPKEIVFTSGATEANNLAIKGVASFYRKRGDHIVTLETEHKAVIDTCKRLAREGFRVTYLRPDADGLVTPEQVADAVDDKTLLVSIMHVNNEIGVVQPIADIAAAVKAKNPKTLFHCDAVQSAGKLPFDVNEMNVDLVALSAHKMYGPKGIGALWVRRKPRVRIDPIIDGGGHERGMRSGTLAVPLIVGFGKAAELAQDEMAEESVRLRALRERLYDGLRSQLDEVYVNGSLEHRVPGNLNISFAFVEGESLLMALKDVAVSSGSACTSASLEPSYVLRSLGVGEELAHTSIRFGIGRFNTEEEVDFVVDLVVKAVRRLRELSPLWEMHQEGVDLTQIEWTNPH
ncbi:IscS subfamily cysteine desulfurase [Haliangium sp.]|uniref:IscS subfamily cysteine desulfurase n=1 Tax=Haliangium sp. TaxID=2663208 RepID=UPI003D10EBD1